MHINQLKTDFKNDLLSGLVVFLVALPLSLGIALASGAPLFAGIISGVIGGIVVGFLSNSRFSVSGPAAGLTAIVLSAITDLGSYQNFLLAVVLAGIFQLILGFAKAGSVSNFFPNNVIEGLLAAIGIIIIIKQLPLAFGIDAVNSEKFFSFNKNSIFSEILNTIQLGDVIITLLSFVILLSWNKINFLKNFKAIPPALGVVILGILTNELFKISHSHLVLDKSHLVNLPTPKHFSSYANNIFFPNFLALDNIKIWFTAITITIVASIETLLCIEATDKLDPKNQKTNTNTELKAQGIGNILSGLIGGIPMTSVIVRSSANINAGAKSKYSSVFHGVFILISVILIPGILNKIPLASLASILILIGYNLAKPSLFKHVWQKGLLEFVPFVITIIVINLTDLLIGVGSGILCVIVFYTFSNVSFSSFFKSNLSISKKPNNHYVVKTTNSAIFSNFSDFKKQFSAIPSESVVDIDFSETPIIDHPFLVNLATLENEFYKNGGEINMIGLDNHIHETSDPYSTMRLVSEGQVQKIAKLTYKQLLIKDLASKYNYHYYNGHFRANPSWINFSYFKAKLIKNSEDILEGNFKTHPFNFLTINGIDNSNVLQASFSVKALYLKEFNYQMPVFRLQKEGTLDKLTEQFSKYKDIDFEEYPQFSEKHLLKSEDEEAIRKIFSPSLIRFLEINSGYYIESNGKDILIIPEYSIDELSDIEKLLEFGKSFESLISSVR
jgi:MFS superfamily sulfate permease-like transporter